MVIKTRARSDSAKEERRQKLLRVARELFAEHGMGFSMLEVAQAAQVAKGTTYLYFATKEEMLLELLREELTAWFIQLHQILEQPQHLALEQPKNMAEQIANSISSRKLMVALFAVQVSILEQNLSYEAALKFKTFLLEESMAVIPKLERAIPNSNGLELLQTLNALVIGLAQMSRPVGTMQEVLKRPEIAVMHVSFATALEQSLITLFKGLETKGDL
jgi:TetR/AcrR family transcriptional regulator